MRNREQLFLKLRRSFHYYRINLILRHSILACELFGLRHYWMRSCRQLKDYRFDFHTAGIFWEGPGDYCSFIFIYRLLNWISDQWGRTVCARTLSFNWNKECRRELKGNTQLIVSSCGAGFRRMMYTVPSRYSWATARLMRVQLPCKDCEGQEAVCLWLEIVHIVY